MPRIALVLLALLVPAVAHAQRLPEVVRSLRPEEAIRVRTRGHANHTGRFTRLHGDTLYLDPTEGSSSWVAVDAVEELWVRRSAAKTGAIIGSVTGALLAGGYSAFIVSALCETDDCGTVGAALVGGLLGAGTGALTGALIGALVPKWHRRFP